MQNPNVTLCGPVAQWFEQRTCNSTGVSAMRRFLFVSLIVASLMLFPATDHSTFAQSTAGLRIFETKCASCHQSQGANDHKAPDAGALRKMTPEAIYAVFAKGAHAQIPNLSEESRKT